MRNEIGGAPSRRSMRRRVAAWASLALLLGAVLGGGGATAFFLCGGNLPGDEKATPVPVLTVAAADETPVARATASPTPLPTDQPVAAGVNLSAVDACTLGEGMKVQIPGAGTLTVRVTRALTPAWYRNNYADMYKLAGTEAGAEIEFTLSAGSMDLDNALTIYFVDASGRVIAGQPLMDKPIGGAYGAMATSGEPQTFYKRYNQTNGASAALMMVEYHTSGGSARAYFSLKTPYRDLTQGDKGEDVLALQTELIRRGYLTGVADGDYGAATAEAVKVAQAALRLSETGVATAAFQEKLFGE